MLDRVQNRLYPNLHCVRPPLNAGELRDVLKPEFTVGDHRS